MPEKLQQKSRRLPERREPPPPLPSSSSMNADGKSVDGDLLKNLVGETVPLVESFLDRRANPAFKRRASMAYTAGPKVLDPKGKKTAQIASAAKQRDHRDNVSNGHDWNQGSTANNFSMFSSRTLEEEEVPNNREELIMLREQLDDLHKVLSEKDEAVRSVEESMKQMGTVYATLDELRRNVAQKELLVTSTSSQLSNAEVKLEEREAAVEKLECEARTASRRVQKLQRDMESMEFEKFALMLLFQELSKNNSVAYAEDGITSFQQYDHLPEMEFGTNLGQNLCHLKLTGMVTLKQDNMSDTELKQMEEARVAYIAALAVAKENPCPESLSAVADARLKLEAFVF